MIESFKTWSESNPQIKEELSPNLGLREWDELWGEEKETIIKYLFPQKMSDWYQDITHSIFLLNEKYKVNSYGKSFLKEGGPHYAKFGGYAVCCMDVAIRDFKQILTTEDQNVIFELISVFAKNLINHELLDKIKENDPNRTDKVNTAYEEFDEFSAIFNDLTHQFGINIHLSRHGLILKQDSVITEQIYEPVLGILSDPKWQLVSRDLGDAFSEYQTKTNKGYSNCITHTVSALQAFLQITVNGKTGKGDIDRLLKQAQEEEKIPNDMFSKKIFKNINSILMSERQAKGNPHPKKEYADEKTSRLLLNLTMIFLQHCIQN